MKKESSRTRTGISRLPAQVRAAIAAAHDRQASNVVVLDLRPAQGFTDYFVICTGQNVRQIKAVADGIEVALAAKHVKPAHVEGHDRTGWILLDYFDFIVHVFSPESRAFFGLERLWGSAVRIDVPTGPARPDEQ